MPDWLVPFLLILAGFVVYIVGSVVKNMRLSERQWEQVDKSKLKKWDDDEDD